MDPRQPSFLDPLRARVRRLQLIVGMGFLAVVVGSILSATLVGWLGEGIARAGSVLLGVIAHALISRFWVYALLPAMCYLAARAFDLRPWTTAIGAALTGEVFVVCLDVVNVGLGRMLGDWLGMAIRLTFLAAGVFLSRLAIIRGRAAAARARLAAERTAEANRAEYARFAEEAARLANRGESGVGNPPEK